jgi:hypothetical protein
MTPFGGVSRALSVIAGPSADLAAFTQVRRNVTVTIFSVGKGVRPSVTGAQGRRLRICDVFLVHAGGVGRVFDHEIDDLPATLLGEKGISAVKVATITFPDRTKR